MVSGNRGLRGNKARGSNRVHAFKLADPDNLALTVPAPLGPRYSRYLLPLARANGLAYIPPEAKFISQNAIIRYFPFE